MIICLGFSPAFLGFPMRCVLSISLSLITKFKCSFIALIHRSAVFSCFFSGIPCSSKQLCLEYCSYLSSASERLSSFCANLETFSVKLFMISSLSFLSCSYLSNFLVIKINIIAKLVRLTFAFNFFFLLLVFFFI